MASQAMSVELLKTTVSDLDVEALFSETPAKSEIGHLPTSAWQRRGCPLGSPELDWFQAEEELIRRQK